MAGRYTEEDMSFINALIKEKYSTKTAHTIASLAGSKFTSALVKKKAHALGFSSYKCDVEWSNFDVKYVKDNYPTKKSMRQLANHFDVNIYEVGKLLEKLALLKDDQKKPPLRRSMATGSDNYNRILASLWDAYML